MRATLLNILTFVGKPMSTSYINAGMQLACGSHTWTMSWLMLRISFLAALPRRLYSRSSVQWPPERERMSEPRLRPRAQLWRSCQRICCIIHDRIWTGSVWLRRLLFRPVCRWQDHSRPSIAWVCTRSMEQSPYSDWPRCVWRWVLIYG